MPQIKHPVALCTCGFNIHLFNKKSLHKTIFKQNIRPLVPQEPALVNWPICLIAQLTNVFMTIMSFYAPGGSPTFVYFPFGIPHVQTQNCKHLKEESQEAFQLSSGSLSLLIEFAHCAVHSSRSNTLVYEKADACLQVESY